MKLNIGNYDGSISDVLFFNSPEELAQFVKEYILERMSEPVDYIPLKFEIIQG